MSKYGRTFCDDVRRCRMYPSEPWLYKQEESSSDEEEVHENVHVQNFIKLAESAQAAYKAAQEEKEPEKQMALLEQLMCKVSIHQAMLEFARIPPDVRSSEEVEKLTTPVLSSLQESEKLLEVPTDEIPGEPSSKGAMKRGPKVTESKDSDEATTKVSEEAVNKGSKETLKDLKGGVESEGDGAAGVKGKTSQARGVADEHEHENAALNKFVKAYDDVRRSYYQAVFELDQWEDMSLNEITHFIKSFTEVRSLFHLIPEKVRKELRSRCTAGQVYEEIGKYLFCLRLFYDTRTDNEYRLGLRS